MGDQFNGTKLLVRAQERDPEMMNDPNFKRHLKQAIEDGALAQRERTSVSAKLPADLPADLYPRPGVQARPQQQFVPQQAQQLVPQQQFVPQQAQQLVPQQQFVPQQPQQFAPQQPQQFAPQQPQQFVPQQPGYRGPTSDTQPVQYVQSPMVRPEAPTRPEVAQGPKFSPLDAQNHTPVEAAATLYAQVINEKGMSPTVQQQFLQAIKNADAGISPRLQPLMQQLAQSRQAIENFVTANPKVLEAVIAVDTQAADFIARMQPPQRMAAAAQLYKPARSSRYAKRTSRSES